MKLQKKNFELLVFLGVLACVVSCGNMNRGLSEAGTGTWEESSNNTEAPSYYYKTNAQEPTEENETAPSQNSPKTQSETKPEAKTENKPEQKAETKPEKEVPNAPVPAVKPTPASIPKEEMIGPGVLKPTVYFFAVMDEDKRTCDEKVNMYGTGGKVLLKVCPKTLSECGQQGSCAVIQKGKTYTFNVIGRVNGQDHFFEIEEDGCRFGYGVNSSCLDPYYTLAADLTIYKPGEVIYVPAVVGLPLPDGSKHTGYFVIRDKGRGIIGRGRFDFFSGYHSWLDPKNPFNKLGLGDVKTNIPYFKIVGETAKKVLAFRHYPELPANAIAKK